MNIFLSRIVTLKPVDSIWFQWTRRKIYKPSQKIEISWNTLAQKCHSNNFDNPIKEITMLLEVHTRKRPKHPPYKPSKKLDEWSLAMRFKFCLQNDCWKPHMNMISRLTKEGNNST